MKILARILGCCVGAALVLTACGGAGTSGSSSTPSGGPQPVPTAEQLAAMLVTPEVLGDAWGSTEGPSDGTGPIGGVVTEEQGAMLPRPELCDAASAEAREAAGSLAWQAFTQLTMTPEDPLDMAAGDRSGHMIFVQESLLAAEPAETERTFTLLRDGVAACMGPMPTEGADGHTGVAEEWTPPAVGQDRYGVLMTVQEPGPPGSSGTWLLRTTLARSGPVLLQVTVVEITLGQGVTPELSPQEVDAVVTAIADRIG